jgi:decaprenylphospho-beta-D-erythro-pentofuranosid-2-ulose 2-reductase
VICVDDGLGRLQTTLVLGGTSHIGLAIADALLTRGGAVVLAGRDPAGLKDAADSLSRPDRRVESLYYDATGPAAATRDVLAAASAMVGDLDVVVVCVGLLADESAIGGDTEMAEHVLRTNLLGPTVAVHAAAQRLRAQGHGTLVVLSSVAAVRARDGLMTYGVAKAAVDRYTLGVAATLRHTGARAVVVRPGHVRTRMTVGLPEAPFTTGPAEVAARVRAAMRRRRTVTYAPAVLRPVMALLRVLPAPLYRRITDPGRPRCKEMIR